MTPSLRRKLEALAERREELERLLADPGVAADNARFRDLSREFAQLEPVAAAADREELSLKLWRDGLTCLSLAGGRPDSWLEVQRQVTRVLTGLDVTDYRLRADGSALRILVPATAPPELARRLHESLLAS